MTNWRRGEQVGPLPSMAHSWLRNSNTNYVYETSGFVLLSFCEAISTWTFFNSASYELCHFRRTRSFHLGQCDGLTSGDSGRGLPHLLLQRLEVSRHVRHHIRKRSELLLQLTFRGEQGYGGYSLLHGLPFRFRWKRQSRAIPSRKSPVSSNS